MSDSAKTIAADIDIVNLALSKLGITPIDNFDDLNNSKAANLAKGSYDIYLRSVMGQYPWDFCTDFYQLSAATLDSKVYGYSAAFDIPSGTLRVYAVQDQSSEDGAEWKVTGGQILTNLADANGQIKAQIISFERNVESYPASFVDALAERCAAEWASTLIGSASETEERDIRRKDKVRDAMSDDGGVGSPIRTTTVASVLRVRGV